MPEGSWDTKEIIFNFQLAFLGGVMPPATMYAMDLSSYY
jgi:hypothetical protein